MIVLPQHHTGQQPTFALLAMRAAALPLVTSSATCNAKWTGSRCYETRHLRITHRKGMIDLWKQRFLSNW